MGGFYTLPQETKCRGGIYSRPQIHKEDVKETELRLQKEIEAGKEGVERD